MDASQVYDRLRGPHRGFRALPGRHQESIIGHPRGSYSSSRPPRGGRVWDVAVDATLRAAAARVAAGGERPRLPLLAEGTDLRLKVRRGRSPYVLCFVVDTSWSVHVDVALERTKGVVLAFLRDAFIHHDKVALVGFRNSRSPEGVVVLQPTSSYALAYARLRHIPLTGSTPLPDALRLGYRLLRQQRYRYANALPVLVVVTDGLANVPLRRGGDVHHDIASIGKGLRRDGIGTVVVDTEATGRDAAASLNPLLVETSGGVYLPLSALNRPSLERVLPSPGDRRLR